MLLVASRYGNWEKLCNLMDHIIRVLTSSNVVRQSLILLCPPHNYEVKLGLKWLETIPNMSNFHGVQKQSCTSGSFLHPKDVLLFMSTFGNPILTRKDVLIPF